MSELDNTKMRKKDISNTLKLCVDLFQVPINFYSYITNNKSQIWRLKIRHNEKLDNRKITIHRNSNKNS
jgi:hypothetical protein